MNSTEAQLRQQLEEAERRVQILEAALRDISKTYQADGNRLIHGELHIIKVAKAALAYSEPAE